MRKLKVQRSELAVPASSARFMENAAQSRADSVFLDLEDSVLPELKVQARRSAIEALNDLDWKDKIVSVRVNGLDTPWGYRDIIEVAEAAPRLDRILLPKCDTVDHVRALEFLLSGVEMATGRSTQIDIEALIETPLGLANVEAIAASSKRIRTMIFGAGDYQLAMKIFERSVGAPSDRYVVLTDADAQGARVQHWNDPWHFALARIANACRAYDIQPIDGPFTNIGDPQGYVAAANRGLALGYEGKWAIHPSQIEHANAVFSPTPEQMQWAQNVFDALEQASKGGRGAVKMANGDMFDLAHVKIARNIVERAQRVAAADAAADAGASP